MIAGILGTPEVAIIACICVTAVAVAGFSAIMKIFNRKIQVG